MATPEFWLLAGPNGAGKSTLAADPGLQSALAGVEIANPDAIALELLRKEGHAGFASAPPDTLRRCFLEAARETEEALFTALAEGRKVGAETVLSTAKYLRHVEETRRLGGTFGMIYIALDSPERSARRVARRVRAGGHDVPADRLARRWRDSLANLPRFAALAAAFWVFDNSDEHPDTPPLLVCRGRAGRIEGEVRDAFSALAEAVAALR